MPRKNKRYERMRDEEAVYWDDRERREREEDGDNAPLPRRRARRRNRRKSTEE